MLASVQVLRKVLLPLLALVPHNSPVRYGLLAGVVDRLWVGLGVFRSDPASPWCLDKRKAGGRHLVGGIVGQRRAAEWVNGESI